VIALSSLIIQAFRGFPPLPPGQDQFELTTVKMAAGTLPWQPGVSASLDVIGRLVGVLPAGNRQPKADLRTTCYVRFPQPFLFSTMYLHLKLHSRLCGKSVLVSKHILELVLQVQNTSLFRKKKILGNCLERKTAACSSCMPASPLRPSTLLLLLTS
jgi:hypothetical protein